MTGPRRDELRALAGGQGYEAAQPVGGTAYLDRSAPAIRKNLGALASGSFVWCVAEEAGLIVGDETHATEVLAGLLRRGVTGR